MTAPTPSPGDPHQHENRVTLAVLAGAMLMVFLLGAATVPKARIAKIRANGGYVLIDNRTRRAVLVVTGDKNGQPCGEAKVVRAGNRGRVRACGPWSHLLVRGPGGEAGAARLMAAQGQLYQVRWRGALSVEQHEAF